MEELLDIFYYIQDVLALNITSLNHIITFHIIEYLVLPIFATNLENESMREFESPIIMGKKLVLFLLSQFFHIILHPALINASVSIFIHPNPENYASFFRLPPQLDKFNHPPDWSKLDGNEENIAIPIVSTPQPESTPPTSSSFDSLYSSMVKPTKPVVEKSPKKIPKNTHRSIFSLRDNLLSLIGIDDDQIVLGALCVLYAIIGNRTCERKLLSQSGMFPHRLAKVQTLFDSLVSGSKDSSSTLNLFGDSGDSDLFSDSKDKEVIIFIIS